MKRRWPHREMITQHCDQISLLCSGFEQRQLAALVSGIDCGYSVTHADMESANEAPIGTSVAQAAGRIVPSFNRAPYQIPCRVSFALRVPVVGYLER